MHGDARFLAAEMMPSLDAIAESINALFAITPPDTKA
jgi:hypothetical protein